MTNKEAIELAIRHIIKDAPGFELDLFGMGGGTALHPTDSSFAVLGDIDNKATFEKWLESEYKPKFVFDVIPLLSKNEIENIILNIVQECVGPGNSNYVYTITTILESEYNPMPEILPGDILHANGIRYIKLANAICLQVDTEEMVFLKSIERSIKKIQRAGTAKNLETIWEA